MKYKVVSWNGSAAWNNSFFKVSPVFKVSLGQQSGYTKYP